MAGCFAASTMAVVTDTKQFEGNIFPQQVDRLYGLFIRSLLNENYIPQHLYLCLPFCIHSFINQQTKEQANSILRVVGVHSCRYRGGGNILVSGFRPTAVW